MSHPARGPPSPPPHANHVAPSASSSLSLSLSLVPLPSQEAPRAHAESNDKPDVLAVTFGGTSIALPGAASAAYDAVPGSGAAVAAVFHRLLRRVAEQPGWGAFGGMVALVTSLLQAADEAAGDELGATLTSGATFGRGSGYAPSAAVRSFVCDHRLPMLAREVEAIIAACDEARNGSVSLTALLHQCRACLPAASKAALEATHAHLSASRGRDVAAVAAQCKDDDVAKVCRCGARVERRCPSLCGAHTHSALRPVGEPPQAFMAFAVELGVDSISVETFVAFHAALAASLPDAELAGALSGLWR